MDCLFEGVCRLVPWEVDCCKSPFRLLISLVVLKSSFTIVAASWLGLKGRAVAWGKGSWNPNIVGYMARPIPYIKGPRIGPPMVEDRPTHNTWKVGRGYLMWFLFWFGLFHLVFQKRCLCQFLVFLFHHSNVAHVHTFSTITSLIFLVGYPLIIQNWKMVVTSYCLVPYIPTHLALWWWAFVLNPKPYNLKT